MQQSSGLLRGRSAIVPLGIGGRQAMQGRRAADLGWQVRAQQRVGAPQDEVVDDGAQLGAALRAARLQRSAQVAGPTRTSMQCMACAVKCWA